MAAAPVDLRYKSQYFRERGNEAYKNFVASTNLQGQKFYLEEAIRLYKQALNEATRICPNLVTIQDSCSASKNIGTASWKLIGILNETRGSSEQVEACHLQAIQFVSKALALGRGCMTYQWFEALEPLYDSCVRSFVRMIKNQTSKREIFVGSIEKCIRLMEVSSHQGVCFLEIAQFTFNEGLACLGEKDFKGAIQAFKDCHRPTQETKRFAELCFNSFRGGGKTNEAKKNNLLMEARIIEEDLVFDLAAAEALQAISIGDNLLELATSEFEGLSLNIDITYDVIDWYKKAELSARDFEVEVEAMALSRIGAVYDKYLKIKYKAKEYFMRSMQLGLSLNRKNLNSEAWFRTCSEAVKRYQEEKMKYDDAVEQQESKKYRDELVEEIKKLTEFNLKPGSDPDPVELIRFIYKEFPPKDPKHKVPEKYLKDPLWIKKALTTAILHYHPDKQNVAKYGKKWKVLCEEITKALTSHYETRKLGVNVNTSTETKRSPDDDE